MSARAVLLGIAAFALVTAGCGGTTGADGRPSPTHGADTTFVVSSSDFADGGTLPDSATANAFDGQCKGGNVNPQLGWTGAPTGTVTYAITLIDISADNFVHWTKADIPATTTEVPTGGADALAGVGGKTGHSSGTYFGPCPPGPDHHYVFTVYALDATLGLKTNFGIGDLEAAMKGHVLAQRSITGLRSGPV
jgi:hypothetical protein